MRGFCSECAHFEPIDVDYSTGICTNEEQLTVKTEDDTCDDFTEVEDE